MFLAFFRGRIVFRRGRLSEDYRIFGGGGGVYEGIFRIVSCILRLLFGSSELRGRI